MALTTLLSQTGLVGPGPITSFPSSDTVRSFQINPQVNVGFSGSLVIEGATVPSPGANDFVTLAEITFTGHTFNFTLEVESTVPFIRARIVTSTLGQLSVHADSRIGPLSGGAGSTPATAVVDSANRVAVNGPQVKLNAPVVPSITSDDVIYANDFAFTVTQVLDGKQDQIGTGNISVAVQAEDVNLLAGLDAAGVTNADLLLLGSLTVGASDINELSGVTSNVQTQLNNLLANSVVGPGVDLTGLTVSASQLNSFFSAPITATATELNILSGLTASTADLNGLTGTAGTYTAADLAKLGSITALAAEINQLSGWTGTSTQLNLLNGLTATTADLNAITGLAGTGVTSTEMAFLSGLTQNVQAALSSIPALGGLTATVNDLNLLAGAFTGTGAYTGAITPTELSYLDGLTSNIQTQLDNKRDISVAIGIAEISGAAITTTELNYLQGSTSNIQAQIDALSFGAITPAGGTFTGPIFIANGSAANPGLGYAGANTTGFYLFGANGYGLSIAGTRFMTADGTDVAIGDGVTGGAPTLKGSGFGVTNPAYAFTGDLDSGMYWAGVDSVGIAAGGNNIATFDGTANQVTVGGPVVDNNVIQFTGIFEGERQLGTTVTVQAGAVSGTPTVNTVPLYTVPAGRSAIITKVHVILTNVTNFTDGSLMRADIGFTAPNYRELVDNTTNTGVYNPTYGATTWDTALQVITFGVGANSWQAVAGSSGADYQVLTAGAALSMNVTALQGADDFDFEVIVVGQEF